MIFEVCNVVFVVMLGIDVFIVLGLLVGIDFLIVLFFRKEELKEK